MLRMAQGENDTRQRCDLLITGGRVRTADGSPDPVEDGAVAVRDGTVVAVGPRATVTRDWTGTRLLDATGQVVAPGFVDAHVHLGVYAFGERAYRPATGPGPFSGARAVEVILPIVARLGSAPVPDEQVRAAVRPALATMLRAGFTGVVDAGGPGVSGVADAVEEVGIRAAVGPSLADHWHDEHGRLVRQADTDRVLASAASTAAAVDGRGDGRVRAAVSAVEPTACSDELLCGIAELATTHDLPTHVHSHVSPTSVAAHDAAFGVPATDRLLQAGLLTDRCTVMHAGALTDRDVAVFAETGVTVNHNPVGNAMLGFGVTGGRSVPRLLEAGVPVVLGSDYAPSTVATPFELIRAALMLQRDLAARDDGLTLEQALAMASSGGACLGRPGLLGQVAVGQLADLVVLDPRGGHHLGVDHPVPALALRGRAGDVTAVVVAGRVVVDPDEARGAS